MEKLPPVRSFWSLTLYNEHYCSHPDELDRCSFGTKITNLHRAGGGSLPLTACHPPAGQEPRAWTGSARSALPSSVAGEPAGAGVRCAVGDESGTSRIWETPDCVMEGAAGND
jgi:Protein of unknown function (DUF1214)